MITDWWFGTFFHIFGIVIPIDEYFSEGLKPPTRINHYSNYSPEMIPITSLQKYGATTSAGENGGTQVLLCPVAHVLKQPWPLGAPPLSETCTYIHASPYMYSMYSMYTY